VDSVRVPARERRRLQGLPQEALEAARVDGASKWQVFRDIVLPLLRPVLVLAAMLRGWI